MATDGSDQATTVIRIVAQAPGAVLIGRELVVEKSMRILIAVDGSLTSEQAIRLMASYFQVESAETR